MWKDVAVHVMVWVLTLLRWHCCRSVWDVVGRAANINLLMHQTNQEQHPTTFTITHFYNTTLNTQHQWILHITTITTTTIIHDTNSLKETNNLHAYVIIMLFLIKLSKPWQYLPSTLYLNVYIVPSLDKYLPSILYEIVYIVPSLDSIFHPPCTKVCILFQALTSIFHPSCTKVFILFQALTVSPIHPVLKCLYCSKAWIPAQLMHTLISILSPCPNQFGVAIILAMDV